MITDNIIMLITDLCKTGSAGLYNYIEFKRSQCYYNGDLGDKLFGSPQAGRISRHFLIIDYSKRSSNVNTLDI